MSREQRPLNKPRRTRCHISCYSTRFPRTFTGNPLPFAIACPSYSSLPFSVRGRFAVGIATFFQNMGPSHRLLKDFNPEYRDLKILRDYATPSVKYTHRSIPSTNWLHRKADNTIIVSSQYMDSPPILLRLGLRKKKNGIG